MANVDIPARCPACGSDLSSDDSSVGICPGCILELALESPALEAESLADSGEAPTLAFRSEWSFSAGQVHGDRYRIRAVLGRGGMGEVWRAYDLKLRQEVALKALRSELIQDANALESLRQEVRAAREVISPNVCRVFDLQELDGQELVSMEYIDGVTLHEILTERSPLPLNEAREIAVQFLAGLEAIHEAGLVHRDIKPENVMRTRTGRVVVMDFGIAKGLREGRGGVIAGTPAYMAPEQARGEGLDARADIFSAGVMLAEIVASGGTHSLADRKRIWRDVRRVPPEVSATPWAKLILKAVAASPEQRFPSAAALTRALEEVTLRAAGDEDIDPYPGLAPFDTDRAKYFYGRELEVEALWKKLRRPHLLALIAPSGSGKSSFLRAGVLATLPEGWSAILVTPGPHPFAALARAVGQQLEPSHHQQESVDLEQQEVAIERIANWRQRHRHALLIVDQFEELFTQSTDETQTRFADFLGRLPIEADTFVLLSMREDFLYHCQPYEPLAPVFTELMPLGALSGNSLRRALVQPALRCGYRFGDEALVDEMVETVSHERAALPLLAFAASRLWQLRDREEGLLTRRAYEQIGGVGGALAQHAEATLERIGLDQVSIVRELFRNLVTSQGTRAARDRDELLSVFKLADGPARRRRFSGERGAWSGEATETEGPTPATGASATAARVLDELIDARLLTSYEVPAAEEGDTPGHKIEIIHESLLSSWPRLVRWRTQDTEGAQLRDELRHQAKVWRDRGRPEDLLWTGTSYREFSLWRERYPGGLTAAEEEFAQAMVARAGRQTQTTGGHRYRVHAAPDRPRRRRRLPATGRGRRPPRRGAEASSPWRRSSSRPRLPWHWLTPPAAWSSSTHPRGGPFCSRPSPPDLRHGFCQPETGTNSVSSLSAPMAPGPRYGASNRCGCSAGTEPRTGGSSPSQPDGEASFRLSIPPGATSSAPRTRSSECGHFPDSNWSIGRSPPGRTFLARARRASSQSSSPMRTE